MDRPGIPSESLRFGLFELDLAARSVTRKGVPVRLQDQPFLVLTLLLERPNDIVTREELRQRLWPDGTYVDFDGSLNAVLKRLRAALGDDPDQPRFIETVPKRGYRFIAPVTRVPKTEPAPDPADAPGISRSHEDTPMPGVARRRPGVLFGALAILLILGAASLWLGRAKAPDSAHAELKPIAARRSVAVLGFQNNSGNSEDAWLSTALSQMLSTELAAGENLRLVSGEEVASLNASSPWPASDTLGRSTTSRIGTALNSDWLVLGSYAVAGEPGSRKLRLDARLQDAATGEIVAELAETGSVEDPFAIVSRLGGQMRDRLGIPPVNESDRPALLASLPSNGEAARFYAQGLMKLREFDALAAKDLLLQAIAVDPKFPLAHSMLAQAWGQLGYDARSREEAKTALDLSADLPRADRMVVEGAYYESLADPEKAVATWRALLTLFPDSLEYGLRLVAMLDRVGRYEEALETIAQLRRLRPPAGDDARLDLWESREISHRSGPDAEAPLQRGLSKAAARGQKLIYADGKVAQCAALQYSDHPGDAFAPCQEAYDTFLAAGNRARATDALRHLADLTSQQGRRDEALPIYDRAIRMARQTGSRSMLAAAQNNMAILLESQGELDRAEAMFRDVRKTFEEVGDALNVLTALDNIGDIQLARGDLRTSEKTFQEVIAR
ncbi:MAG TPA: winged helix-turn-helix domain-containing protein, partial [Candidatus Polarisedimenticolia bacterium]|nr:winged helix-turn-helix domain-containing protein [Candidatus Polarisedimenticolia bacterium]